MPFGVDDIKDTSEIVNPFLKIALIGRPGVGKSWLASTAPKPVLNWDFDGRAASLVGKPGVFVKTYVDKDPNNPTAMSEVERDLNKIEYEFKSKRPVPATNVLDSLTYMRKATENELMKQQSSLSRTLKVGVRNVLIPSGWDIINGNRNYIEYVIGRLSSIGNLIVICHEQDEKDNVKSTKETKAYTGKVTIQPQYMNTILSLFDDVWYVDTDYKGERKVQTGISVDFDGKTTLDVDNIEEANIEKMLAKSAARKAAKAKV